MSNESMTEQQISVYPLRILTAMAALENFDAPIQIVRRLLQDGGCEVIHMGHNQGLDALVDTAIQEDVDAVCISALETSRHAYFTHLIEQLVSLDADRIQVYVICGQRQTDRDIKYLHSKGVARVYQLGAHGKMDFEQMTNEVMLHIKASTRNFRGIYKEGDSTYALANNISLAQNRLVDIVKNLTGEGPIKTLAVAGAGGSGKTSFIDELINQLLEHTSLKIACLAIDPSRHKSGGALLGDRLGMTCLSSDRVYFRSMATRNDRLSVTTCLPNIITLLHDFGYDLVVIEASGIGQTDHQVCKLADHSLLLMNPDFGTHTQLEKAAMLGYVDTVVLNKYDYPGSEEALKLIRHQWRRLHNRETHREDELPVYPMISDRVNNHYAYPLIEAVCKSLNIEFDVRPGKEWLDFEPLIPQEKANYLADICLHIRAIKLRIEKQSEYLQEFQNIYGAIMSVRMDTDEQFETNPTYRYLHGKLNQVLDRIDQVNIDLISSWEDKLSSLQADYSVQMINGSLSKQKNYNETASHTSIPVISTSSYSSWGDQLRFLLHENLPGEFPYTAGIEASRDDNLQTLEYLYISGGAPEDANHKLLQELNKQLRTNICTWFDAPTRHARDPSTHVDIYEAIGEGGVSVATLDDVKKLYSGINLCDEHISITLVAQGAAPLLMALFVNAALDQQIELYLKQQGRWNDIADRITNLHRHSQVSSYNAELGDKHNGLGLGFLGINPQQIVDQQLIDRIAADCYPRLSANLHFDPLEADQAQNGSLYPVEFSLQLMSDLQKYVLQHHQERFNTISISGYHIARAGANPVTQLAFTLANGLTILEHYMASGLALDEIAHLFNFILPGGLDAEYAVIGRVARRIWSRTLKYVYGADEASQKLRLNLQTEGYDSHSQSPGDADIRATLSALLATYNNVPVPQNMLQDGISCTSVIESHRRARRIQHQLDQAAGINLSLNPLQGSFLITELTELVEEAVLREFDRLSERGGVPGAIESLYQRNRIQEESFTASSKAMLANDDDALSCHEHDTDDSDTREQHTCAQQQINATRSFVRRNRAFSPQALQQLSAEIMTGNNSFEALLSASRFCTLQQMSDVLNELGGVYRRKL